MTAPGIVGTSPDRTLENLGLHQGDDPVDVSAGAVPDPTGTDPLAPQESGDRP